MNDNAKKFLDRQAYWVGEGLTGRAVYDRLAVDTEVPVNFDERAAAEITGLSPHTMRQRRHRGAEPSFTKFSARCVRYPREALCTWLAETLRTREAGR